MWQALFQALRIKHQIRPLLSRNQIVMQEKDDMSEYISGVSNMHLRLSSCRQKHGSLCKLLGLWLKSHILNEAFLEHIFKTIKPIHPFSCLILSYIILSLLIYNQLIYLFVDCLSLPNRMCILCSQGFLSVLFTAVSPDVKKSPTHCRYLINTFELMNNDTF